MKSIIFINPYRDDSEKSLVLYDSEKDMEERIVQKVLERISLTVDATKAIQQIKELQDLLDQFENRFK